MPKLAKSASKKDKKARMEHEMGKFKEGRMHSGSKTGPVVTDRAQAIAIALNESGQSKKNRKKRSKSRGGRRSGRSR
jgi:hypothetical protein